MRLPLRSRRLLVMIKCIVCSCGSCGRGFSELTVTPSGDVIKVYYLFLFSSCPGPKTGTDPITFSGTDAAPTPEPTPHRPQHRLRNRRQNRHSHGHQKHETYHVFFVFFFGVRAEGHFFGRDNGRAGVSGTMGASRMHRLLGVAVGRNPDCMGGLAR